MAQLIADGTIGIWNRLVASDPGLVRLRFAGRAVLAGLLGMAVLLPLRRVLPIPVPALVLAFMLGVLATVAVRDPTPARQRGTMLLMVPIALASACLAAALVPWPVAARGGFLAIVFAAVYARRFGPRWNAIGMVSFNAHFLGTFLRPSLDQWPFLALGIVVGIGSAMALNFVLMPDRPAVLLRRVLHAVFLRIAAILDASAEGLGEGGWTDARIRRLRRRVSALNEAVLMAEGHLEALRGTRPDDEERWDALRWTLLTAELAAERVAATAPCGMPPPTRQALASRLADLARATGAMRRPGRPRDNRAAEPARLALAVGEMEAALDGLLDAAARDFRAPGPPSRRPPPPAQAAGRAGGLRATTRQSIQAAAACALAMAGGFAVSGDRWQWAVLTAFVVFSGARSSADILDKSLQRVLGTLAGVGAGAGVAVLVAGHPAIETTLALASLFLGLYFLQLSQAVMVFWITVMLALLYESLGVLTPEALAVRLDETVIGALAGAGAATLVLPVRTGDLLRSSGRELLGTLRRLVDSAVARLAGAAERRRLVDAARALDRGVQDLRGLVRSGPRGASLPPTGRRALGLEVLAACSHWGRDLVLAGNASGPPPAEAVMAPIGAAGRRVCDNLDELCRALASRGPAALQPVDGLLDEAEAAMVETGLAADQRGRICRFVQALRRLDRTLQRFAGLLAGP